MTELRPLKYITHKCNHQPYRIPAKHRVKCGTKNVISPKGKLVKKPKRKTVIDPTNDLKTYYNDYVNHEMITYTYRNKKRHTSVKHALQQIAYNSDFHLYVQPKDSLFVYNPGYRMTEYGANLIDKILDREKCCLVEVGTGGGKTYMAIDAIAKRNPNAIILIVAPISVCTSRHWENSVAAFNRQTGSHLSCITINYAKVRTTKRYKFLVDLLYILKRRYNAPTYIVLDEAHKSKNRTGVTTRMIRKLVKLAPIVKMICLTATAASNSLLDYGSYLIYAGFYRNQSDFYRHHVYPNMVNKKFGYQPIVKDRSGKVHNDWLKDLPLLKKRIQAISMKISTKQFLPPVTYIQVPFHMNKVHTHEYRQIAVKYREGRYDSIQKAISAQNKYIAAHCNQRLHYLKRFIDSPKRPKTPILIFYQYVADFDQLMKFFKKNYPNWYIQRIDGRISKDQRIKNTQKPTHTNTVVLIQYQSGSEGLNAQWSSCSIFYAPTTSYQLFKQARGRNVRAMQKGRVYQVRFFVKNTLNGEIWQHVIDQKQRFTQNVAKELLAHTAREQHE